MASAESRHPTESSGLMVVPCVSRRSAGLISSRIVARHGASGVVSRHGAS